ncbi:MAG: SIS domain-containing protein, partial [Acidobacteriota bacterium]
MCGIIGYVGDCPTRRRASEVILRGLSRIDYRGYDSAGMTLFEPGTNGDGKLVRFRTVGEASRLVEKSSTNGYRTSILGIGHTRWATHGKPSEENAHPHASCLRDVMVVHNGEIENYEQLRRELETTGCGPNAGTCTFSSETDTEVLAHRISREYYRGRNAGNFFLSVKRALRGVIGTFGLAAIHREFPDRLVAARRSSSVVLGIGESENFLASDPNAFSEYTDKVVYLDDEDVALVMKDRYMIESLEDEDGVRTARDEEKIALEDTEAEDKGSYEHYMLKEIFDQRESLARVMGGRLISGDGRAKLDGLKTNSAHDYLAGAENVFFVGCGTSGFAGEVGVWVFERLTDKRVEVYSSSTFLRRNIRLKEGRDAVVVLSYSGETADTLDVVRELRDRNLPVFGITGVVRSPIGRETTAGVHLHIGREFG